MSVEAVLADGERLTFPDGTPPEVIRRTVKSRIAEKKVETYEPIPGAERPQLPIVEAMPKPGRSLPIGAGAQAGAMLGTPAGPVGMLVGGGLGAAAGSYAASLEEQISAAREGRPDPFAEKPFEPTLRAGGDAMDDLLWSMGGMAVGPVLRQAKPLMGRALGVFTPSAKKTADLAHSMGVELGVQHLSPRSWVKAYPRVLGVFPFTAGPIRKGQTAVAGQLDDAARDLLNTLAPTATTHDIGKALTKAALRKWNRGYRVSSDMYKAFYNQAAKLPADKANIVPTQPISDELAKVAAKIKKETIELTSGEALRHFGSDAIGEWLEQLKEIPAKITVEQARGFERELNRLLRQAAKENWDVSRLSGMKSALEKSKNLLDTSGLPKELGDEILHSWRTANLFFANLVKTFDTATARKLGRVRTNMFNKKVFKPGTIEADEAFKALFNAKSPEALQNLRKVVGNKEFKIASRRFLQEAMDSSIVKSKEGSILPNAFSAQKFATKLKLDSKEGRDALAAMLRHTDVTPKDFDNFIKVAEKATDITIGDPSSFVLRRFILGAGLTGGLLAGGNTVTIPTAVFITWLARKGGAFLMNPKQLHLATRVLDDTVADHLRRTSLIRLIRMAEGSLVKPAQGNERPTMPGLGRGQVSRREGTSATPPRLYAP